MQRGLSLQSPEAEEALRSQPDLSWPLLSLLAGQSWDADFSGKR